MKQTLLFLIITITICTLSCSSCKKETVTDPNGLPTATQTGANTLGFLLNGQPWKPEGFAGTSNLSIDVDFGYKNGIFSIAAYQVISSNNITDFGIGIADSLNFVNAPKTFKLGSNTLFGVYYSKDTCTYDYFSNSIYRTGSLTITRLDKTARIISGTFYATLAKQGCDTVKITDGRFDMKY